MQIQGSNQVHGPQGPNGPHFRKAQAAEPKAQPSDQLELSSEALEASRLAEAAEAQAADAPVRSELVNRLRSEIASGSYETAEKLDVALDRLLDEIG